MPQPADNQDKAALERLENSEALNLNTEDGLPPSRQTTLQRQSATDDSDNDGDGGHVVIPRSPQDDARSAIASRFRRAAPEDERPFNGDMSDVENIYGDHGRQLDEDEPDDTKSIVGERPQPQVQQPRMITRKVRGKDITLSEDEWLDRASQVTAADSYLEEARALLSEAKTIKAGRSASTGQHQDRTEDAPQLDPDADGEAQHPEPSFKSVVEKIQYGDPDEAAADLERLVDTRTTKRVSEDQATRLFEQDLARSQKALKSFIDANPDLANDEIAAMAIERGMYGLYKEDIVKLGLPEDKIPSDPATLANWHRHYRTHGYEVRNTSDLLELSKGKFLKWRGGDTGQQQQQQPRREAPRVQINVDRNERRAAIPTQPTRTTVPRRETAPAAPSSRSDVVANMRRARGQL